MNTVQDFLNFNKKTRTQQASILADRIKSSVACSSGDVWYAFDEQSKLWKQYNAKQYHTYFCNYIDDVITQIKTLIPTIVCECDGKKCNCERGILQTMTKEMDKKDYIADIASRSYGILYDSEFETKINSNPEILSIMNGKKINLRTLEVSDKTKEDLCTFECAVNYTTETQHADRFFKDIMPNVEEREYLRQCLVYMLTGDVKARVYFVWYGNGSNGKSVVVNLMKKILSTYYTMADKAVFVKGKEVSGGGASPHLYALLGKRLIAYSEGETADEFELNMSILKNISGDDEISCRGLFKDQITFKSIGKLNLLTNYVPRLTTEKAVKDRTRMIFFDQEFDDNPTGNQKKKDTDFIESLENEHLSQVFSWIVQGAKLYFDGGRKIEMPTNFQTRSAQMMAQEDSIEAFFKYRCIFTKKSSDYIKRSELFELYKQYCNENSQRCQPRSTLYARLGHLKIETCVLHGLDIYRGIKIKMNADTDEPNPFDNGIIDEDKETIKRQAQQIEELKKQLEELKKQITPSDKKEDKPIEKLTEEIIVKKKTVKRSKKNTNMTFSLDDITNGIDFDSI